MSRLSALFAALLLPLLASAPASGVELQTTLLGDAVDAVPGDGVCDADTTTPLDQCTLRAAVQEANALPGADTIKLRAARYSLSLAGPNEDAAAAGDLDITSDITIDGQSYQTSLIDGRRLEDRIFDVRPGASLRIDQTSLLFGKSPKPELEPAAIGPGAGGCLRSTGAIALDDVFFYRCAAPAGGGCLSVQAGTADLTDSVFAACRAKAEGGGLELAAGASANLARVTGGVCRAAAGGAVAARGALSLRNVTFTLNRAKLGGGVAVLGDGAATIANSTLSSNRTSNLLSQTTGAVSATNSIVWGAKIDCVGPVSSGGGNLEGAASCAFGGTNDQQGQDPLLEPLAFNGGPVPTQAIGADSPALDHGFDGVFAGGDACQDDVGDARELRRVESIPGGAALTDVGAFERGGAPAQPTISSTPVTSATVDAAYSYDVAVQFPGRDVCRTYSLTTQPAGMTIDPGTGLIAWTPGAGQTGANPVVVRVEDDLGGVATQTFTITVAPAP
jgi:hypothetical protein